MDRDRRINRAGNSRARKTLVQLARLWLRYQPESSHAAWFRDRVGSLQGRFFSLAECNEAIALVMQRMNDRPMRNLGLSRRELFEKIERDALIALPADDWEFAEWRRARVNLDYHIDTGGTDPASTRRNAGGSWACDRGPCRAYGPCSGADGRRRSMTSCIRSRTSSSAPRSTCGSPRARSRSSIAASAFRTCLGILRSYRGLDPGHLEAVSARAVELGVLTSKGVASLLARKRDAVASRPATLFDHANLRGPGYYH